EVIWPCIPTPPARPKRRRQQREAAVRRAEHRFECTVDGFLIDDFSSLVDQNEVSGEGSDAGFGRENPQGRAVAERHFLKVRAGYAIEELRCLRKERHRASCDNLSLSIGPGCHDASEIGAR